MGVCHTKSHVQATGRGIRTEGMLRTGLPRPTLPLHEALPTLRPCPVRRPRPPAHTWRPKGQGGAGPAPSRAEGAAVRRAGWQRPNSSSDCPSFRLSAVLLRARGCPPALGPSVSSSAEGGDNPTAAGALQRASNDGAGGARPEGGRRLPRAAPLRPEGHRRLPARSAVGAPGFEPGSADSHAAAGAPLPAALPPALCPPPPRRPRGSNARHLERSQPPARRPGPHYGRSLSRRASHYFISKNPQRSPSRPTTESKNTADSH